jgi:hypothetical protein
MNTTTSYGTLQISLEVRLPLAKLNERQRPFKWVNLFVRPGLSKAEAQDLARDFGRVNSDLTTQPNCKATWTPIPETLELF